MAILIDEHTRVVVQGITGRIGRFHTEEMIDYGTNVVAGVTPGKGGQHVLNRPIFNTMKDAVAETGASSPKDMGQVMKASMARVAGRADGKRVSALAQEALRG